MTQGLRSTLALIRSDFQFRCDYENKRLTALQCFKFLLNSGTLAAALYRLQIFLYGLGWSPLAGLLRLINALLFTVHIDSRTEIGPGLFIMHANYLFIGPYVRIGARCRLAHQNTIAPSPFVVPDGSSGRRGPTLGDDVSLGGGACVIGPISLGNGVQVSMNAAVDSDFPDHATLFGVPAKNLARQSASVESA